MSTPAFIRREVLVSGQGQGVFFRQPCRRVAMENHVCGSAENLPDGRVPIVLEGAADDVNRVIDWCRSGPPSARVDNVQISESEVRGEVGFETR